MAPSTSSGWRFVEKDLYEVARRVTEYDRDARLVRQDGTGQLGLARWVKSNVLLGGGYWALARELHDLDTDAPLNGEPDARILRCQRSYDSWGRSLRRWHERSKDAAWRREAREQDEIHEVNTEHAERFVNALKKDVSARPRAFFREKAA